MGDHGGEGGALNSDSQVSKNSLINLGECTLVKRDLRVETVNQVIKTSGPQGGGFKKQLTLSDLDDLLSLTPLARN